MTNIEIAAALIVGILSVARTARLIGFDEYPPMVWLRDRWDERIGDEGWGKLIHCPFCATPYLAAGMALWFWLGGEHWTWWVINGVWGFSYVAAIIVAYDQPE
jgi:hypothetical protein